MNLAQMYSLANEKSGYSRSDAEIYSALNRAGFRVYSETVNAFRGFFIKFDETFLTLQPNVSEYALPADLTQIVHLAERQSSSQNWLPMSPLDLDSALSNTQNNVGWFDYYAWGYGNQSPFGFYGPYLDSTATTGVQTQKIRVSPLVDASRFCQLAYTAKWLPIVNNASKVMLPDEGTPAMESYASAALCESSDDTRAEKYERRGDSDLNVYLKWMRARQIQAPLTIETYGPGW